MIDRDIAKRAVEVLGPERGERTREIARAMLDIDAVVIDAFGEAFGACQRDPTKRRRALARTQRIERATA